MRPVLAAALLFLSTPALAGPICVVDLQKAVSETKEGKAAQKRLDGMFSSKRADLARMETNLQAAVKDYEGRRDILSPTARADEEQKLLQQQQQLQQTAAQAEAEMQQTYVGMLGELDKKLRGVAEKVRASAGCTVLIDTAAVVAASSEAKDLTSALVAKYDAQYP